MRAIRGIASAATIGLVAAGVAALVPASADAATVSSVVRLLPITVNGSTLNLEYCGNGSVTTANAAITRVVIVVHGDSRTACSQSTDVQTAASSYGVLSSTLVVAPHFYADVDGSAIPANTLYWTDGGWKSGDPSRTSPYSRPWTISSYSALDRLVRLVTDPAVFPNVSRLTVAGHSAGGQFTNRYAATTQVPASSTPSVTRTYVVANPSSYVYLSPERYASGTFRALTSAEAKACTSYDRWKYGMQRRNTYAATLTSTSEIAQYRSSTVRYLAGELDTDPTDASLDTSCGAKWQGTQRLERSQRYYSYLGWYFGQGVYTSHSWTLVPGVGHSAKAMFTSTQGQVALFG